jgi:hypothetical protein
MESIKNIWNWVSENIASGARQQSSALTLPPTQVDHSSPIADKFEPGEDYFQVRVNQMFLTKARKWFTQIDPMVFVASEFQYNKELQAVPFVVGPSLLERFGQQVPRGMMFRNTTVAGLHPYRGGALSLTVVLFQLPVNDLARGFLKVIENMASALNFATALETYVKVGSVILEGVQTLLGLKAATPLTGLRISIDPQAGDAFRPSYFVLIDAPNIQPGELWVRDNQLLKGTSIEVAAPYDENDFVLYSIVRAPDQKRSDFEQLPFYQLYERAMTEAGSLKEGSWENAKGNLISLLNALVLSPDLTRKQALGLYEKFQTEVVGMRDLAIRTSKLGPERAAAIPDRLDSVREAARAILNLP